MTKFTQENIEIFMLEYESKFPNHSAETKGIRRKLQSQLQAQNLWELQLFRYNSEIKYKAGASPGNEINISGTELTHHNIHITNNNKDCFKVVLPIYSRITYYMTHKPKCYIQPGITIICSLAESAKFFYVVCYNGLWYFPP